MTLLRVVHLANACNALQMPKMLRRHKLVAQMYTCRVTFRHSTLQTSSLRRAKAAQRPQRKRESYKWPAYRNILPTLSSLWVRPKLWRTHARPCTQCLCARDRRPGPRRVYLIRSSFVLASIRSGGHALGKANLRGAASCKLPCRTSFSSSTSTGCTAPHRRNKHTTTAGYLTAARRRRFKWCTSCCATTGC